MVSRRACKLACAPFRMSGFGVGGPKIPLSELMDAQKSSVILNLFQDPSLDIDGGLLGKMDTETSSG